MLKRLNAMRKRVHITTPAGILVFWGVTNALAVVLLAGIFLADFTPDFQDKDPFVSGYLIIIIYGSAAVFVFLVSLIVWLIRHRDPYLRGLREPPGMAVGATVTFAIGALVFWLGLAFGGRWMSVLAAVPFVVAGALELFAFFQKARA